MLRTFAKKFPLIIPFRGLPLLDELSNQQSATREKRRMEGDSELLILSVNGISYKHSDEPEQKDASKNKKVAGKTFL